MINGRLFGSPISGKIRKELERRQNGNSKVGKTEFGESVNVEGYKSTELGEKTPFVRMWTSLKFSQQIDFEDVYVEFEVTDDVDTVRQTAEQFSTENPTTQVTPMYNENNEIIRFIVTNEENTRQKVDYATKTYIIGDNNYQKSYGVDDVNTPINLTTNVLEQGESTLEGTLVGQGDVTKIFPNKLSKNPLLKPQEGITSISSETEGTLGVIKKTTINFVVHNFYDFDRIYNKYFLKPGATIFVDFGWNDIKNLYNPEELLNSPSIKQFLFGDPENNTPGFEDEELQQSVVIKSEPLGKITENEGKLEVLQGIVTDYSSKILSNGSVECSVTLTSSNSALLNTQTSESTTRKIQHILTKQILYLAFNNPEIETPSSKTSTAETEIFNANLKLQAQKYFSGKNLTPGSGETEEIKNRVGQGTGEFITKGNSIRSGVFIDSQNADDIYVSWGFIENIIFNENFGFGEGVDEINNGGKNNVRIDSSNSFTVWNEVFLERQKTMSYAPESKPVFIYPEWWGGSDPSADSINADGTIDGGSYSYQQGKYPELFYQDKEPLEQTNFDIENNRIPIREVFINVETIIKAFQNNKSVKKIINNILTDINNDSSNVFDWKIKQGEIDSELIIVDNNFPITQQKINASGISNNNNENDVFENLFTFKIMDNDSTIKDYNLDFKLPSGNIGNMYAVQGMSHDTKVIPLTDLFDDALAISALDEEGMSLLYRPDLSGYRAKQIASDEEADSNIYDNYQNAKELLSTDTYNSSVVTPFNGEVFFIETPANKIVKNQKKSQDETDKERFDRFIKINMDKLETLGNRVTKNFSDYYKLKEIKDISLKQRPNLLPFTLSLTTYGIANITPGDTFRVDYLPKIYQKNVYLQTMKVSHEINSSGWFTTLETQFRPKPEIKKQYYLDINRDNIYLSPRTLLNLNLNDLWLQDTGTFGKDGRLSINDFIPFITELKVKKLNTNYIPLILEFKTTKEIEKLEQGDGIYNYDYRIFLDKLKAGYYGESSPSSVFSGYFYGEEIENIPHLNHSGNDLWYYPNIIKLEKEKTYYLIINDNQSYITNETGITEQYLKYFDHPIYNGSLEYEDFGKKTNYSSDRRLKTNIKFVNKSSLGINIYEFNYINKSYGDGRYRGVMAQEVPWASIKDDNGYYMVDYSKVDVPFEKIN